MSPLTKYRQRPVKTLSTGELEEYAREIMRVRKSTETSRIGRWLRSKTWGQTLIVFADFAWAERLDAILDEVNRRK